MGLVARAAGFTERRAVSGDKLEKYLITGVDGSGNSAGVNVDQTSALSSTALFQALRILTASVGMVPLAIYQRTDPGRKLLRDHPANRVLQEPNDEITAIEFRQMVTSFAASAGNGYAQIVFDGAGRPKELWPIPPHRISPDRAPNGMLRYEVQTPDGPRYLPMEEVFHLRGFMRGGLLGVDVIEQMQEAVGLSIATQKFAGGFFGNGSFLSGWLKFPNRMSADAKKNVRESLDRKHTGVEKAHRIGFLEEGMEWVASGVPPEAAQLIETRRFGVEEIARALNVPPHLLHHLERATFNNIEHLGISFVVYSLGEWYARWEQMLAKRLLLPSERMAGLYAKHNAAGLLRGDHAARATFYQALYQLGVLSPNDIRELEEMNPIDGGDRYFVRRDTVPLDSVDELVASLTAPSPGPAPERSTHISDAHPTRILADVYAGELNQRDVVPIAEVREARERRAVDARLGLRNDYRDLFREAAESTVRKEAVAIRAAIKKAFGGRDAARLRELVDEFYESHDEWIAERFLTLLRNYARRVASEAAREADGDVPATLDAFMADYAATFGKRWAGSSAGQLRKLLAETDPAEVEAVVEARLSEWEATRAAKEADREVVEAGEAVTALVYAGAGVVALKWRTTGENCPLCTRLNGRTVGVQDYFVREGETVDPEDGTTAPLVTKVNVRHPPLHRGCDCAIVVG